jgi:hypothetical protein
LGAFLAFEVELGGLKIPRVTPEMIPFPVFIDWRNRFRREKRNLVPAVEAAFDDKIAAANIRHGPFVIAGSVRVCSSHGNLIFYYTKEIRR